MYMVQGAAIPEVASQTVDKLKEALIKVDK
jgi:hypothetical protein